MPPLYDYRCKTCGTVEEVIRCIANRHDPVECGICEDNMELVISPVQAKVVDPAVPKRQR